MKLSSKLPTAARLLLGLVFLVFGLNGFLHFLPQPPPPARALGFLGGLASAGYFFPLLKGTEVLGGALLLAGFVPFALTLLAPIVVNIVAFHAFLAPGNWPVVALVLAGEIYLAVVNRAAFAPLFARPGRRAPAQPASLAAPLHHAA
ncbi:MAG TPA: DoxX family protein [Polyangia bacterium]|nr:DoxX family protein [Polyangia bacterium]